MMPMATKVATSTSSDGICRRPPRADVMPEPEHHPDRGGGDAGHDRREAGQRDQMVIDRGGRDHDHERAGEQAQ